MSEEQPSENHGIISQHRFMLLIGLTIMISVFLVGVALALYASSGAAQLDLSRPGYVSVRDQVPRSNSFDGFSASGTLDKAAIDEFRTMYTQQAESATNVDSFAGDVMSDKSLSIDAPK